MSHFKSMLSFLLIVLVLLAGCGKSDSDKDKNKVDNSLPPRLQEIQRAGKLVVGTALTVPFEYHEAETNNLVGFDVDTGQQNCRSPACQCRMERDGLCRPAQRIECW